MKIWIDVYNPLGVRIGQPIVNVLNASITRALDGGGSFTISVPATDVRASQYLDNENRVKIWYWDGAKRLLGEGIIDTVAVGVSESGFMMKVSGPDMLDLLTRKTTLLNRQFSDHPAVSVVGTLLLEVGWSGTVVGSISGNVTARFDGTNILKACMETVKGQGAHLRMGDAAETLEIGTFGDDSGVVLVSAASATDDLLANDNIALITRLNLVKKTNAVYNRLIPLAGGEGRAALTLEKSTRGTPYVIQTMVGHDGRTLYYLEDAASVAQYGVIEKVATFKQISPLSNNESAITHAANALYDAAAAELSRNAVRQDVYSVSCKKMRQTIKPGDKIWVRYKGRVYIDGVPVTPLDINNSYYVIKLTERVSQSGASLDLTISTVDKVAESAENIIVGAIDSINVRNLRPVTGITVFTAPQTDTMDGGYKDAEFKLELQDFVTDVVKVVFTFTTRPLYATGAINQSGVWAPVYYPRILMSPAYPKDIHIEINGVDVTADPDIAAAGAPWNPSGSHAPVTVSLDITAYVLANGIHNPTTVKLIGGTGFSVTVQYSGYTGATSAFSQGYVDGNFIVLAVVQAIEPGT